MWPWRTGSWRLRPVTSSRCWTPPTKTGGGARLMRRKDGSLPALYGWVSCCHGWPLTIDTTHTHSHTKMEAHEHMHTSCWIPTGRCTQTLSHNERKRHRNTWLCLFHTEIPNYAVFEKIHRKAMREQLAKRWHRDADEPLFSLALPPTGTLENHLYFQCPHFTLGLYNLTHIWAEVKLTPVCNFSLAH